MSFALPRNGATSCPLSSSFPTRLPKYLLEAHQFTIVNSAMLASAPFAGNVLGNLVGGWISDNIFARGRKPLMLASAVFTIIMMVIMMNAPHDRTMLGLVLFLVGFLLSLGYSDYSVYAMGRVEKASYRRHQHGRTDGAVIMPLVVGVLLDHYDWSAVFMALSITAVVCLGVVLTIREPVPVENA